MGNIVLLDDLTINQIAAGEVIERPANVVKELVENSIDAGANNIVIEIKKGGKTFIRITDNGKGIRPDDMFYTIERHATSKIRQLEDLDNTYTMGFRGEALASIASISKLSILSKTEELELGNHLIVHGGDVISYEEEPCKTGTIITVEELFYNTPVRYKFLKQDQFEFRNIKELVQKIALANPNVAIKLINDGKEVLKTNGNGSLKDLIYVMYDKETVENVEEIEYTNDGITITGVVGNTFLARGDRKNQISFLNRRYIKNMTVQNSADQAFKASIGIGKYGFYIINIDMPASEYDVNVHPTKKEVRFKDEEKLYKTIYYAIKNTSLNKEFLGNTETQTTEDKKNYLKDEFKFATNYFKNNKYFNKLGLTQKNDDILKKPEDETVEEIEEELRKREKRDIKYKYLGILFKTYILVEIDNEIYMIDQHAGHERLLYETIKENYKKNFAPAVQMTLIPEIYTLTNKEFEFVKNNMELFKNIGFDLDIFGDNEIKVNGIPDLDYRVDKKQVFLDILDEMISTERNALNELEYRFIATVACKAAVKAGMVLTESEVKNLIENLLVLKDPYTCPHGRPTTIKFNKNDLNVELM